MIDRLIALCARRPLTVLVVVGVLVVFAIQQVRTIPLDALPDLSDTQVIVYSRWDRSPDILEDQVTYPIISALLGAPRVKTIRGFSDFGFSYVYVIFEDGTDLYWARSRVLEYLSKILPVLPEGVRTELGPDATGVGWVYQYALIDRSGRHDLAELRSFQDWNLRYALQAVPGVAEVASIGGFVRQYQVTVDPNRLVAYDLSVMQVADAIRKSNVEVGGRLIEISGAEFMVRGRGYLKQISDLEQAVLKTDEQGTPVLLRDVARVQLGPDIRRGVVDFDGIGDAVGGIVVMRHGENALNTIQAVKTKLAELKASLPEGVELVPVYDRSELIHRSIHTLKHELLIEMAIVSGVILIFLWHIPSAAIPIFTLPVAVLLAFIPMRALGVSSNIMSLGGIAVAIGALVDAAVVVVENAHKRLEAWDREGRHGDYREVLIRAIQEVGRPSFYSLLVIAVSFLPIFALEAQEGRLFKPLAFTKNLSMAVAAVLAITLDPALRLLFTRLEPFTFRPRPLAWLANAMMVGKMHPEERHPISRVLFFLYEPVNRFVLRFPKLVILTAIAVVALTVPVYRSLDTEFMPPLNEGAVLYMPTTLPGISVGEAQRWLTTQDRLLKTIPEVERVFGKAGRAETSTDPAPFSMVETNLLLKPESEWRTQPRWYSSWAPNWLKPAFRLLVPETLTWDELVNEMDSKLRLPGTTNAWTMPIKNRIDMLTTGVRTPVGVKVFGADLAEIERIGTELERILPAVAGTRSVYAERVAGGYFLDFDLRREQLARYGLSVADAQTTIMTAIGGDNITTTVEGRARYPVNLRYPRELRDNVESLRRVLVRTASGAQIPLEQLADIHTTLGPSMIRDENGRLAGYVYVDVDTSKRAVGSYVAEAKELVASKLKLPEGYSLTWSGQYEAMERVRARLQLVVPITLAIVFALIYFNTGSVPKTLIVLMAVPFSMVGAVWLLKALGFHVSIGVWVGIIALLGLDAETGIFMLLYLDLAFDEWKAKGRMASVAHLKEAIHHGAVMRVRPKVMTVACAFMGLVPILFSTGSGADVMKRIAAPMIGGLTTSFVMELAVYPAIYLLWRSRGLVRAGGRASV